MHFEKDKCEVQHEGVRLLITPQFPDAEKVSWQSVEYP